MRPRRLRHPPLAGTVERFDDSLDSRRRGCALRRTVRTTLWPKTSVPETPSPPGIPTRRRTRGAAACSSCRATLGSPPVRRPSDIPPPAARINPRGHRRLRIWIIVAVVVVIVLLASLRTLATFYTDYLWFGSVHQPAVWRGTLGVKLGLFLVFAAVFFVVLWVNLAVVDRMTPSMLTLGPEDELVRRYQHIVIPRAFLVRTIVSVVIALIAASSTIGQWQNWLLYVHARAVRREGPAIRQGRQLFRVQAPVHPVRHRLGVRVARRDHDHHRRRALPERRHKATGEASEGGTAGQGAPFGAVAVIAVAKAVGYYYQRFTLDFSSNGYVQGAGYTDVHARLPAITLLFWISLLAAVILLVNIRGRGWLLPVLAVGLWAFVAVVVGAIYPAVVQALKVSPAQSKLELPYIQRNINATQAAYDLTPLECHPGVIMRRRNR